MKWEKWKCCSYLIYCFYFEVLQIILRFEIKTNLWGDKTSFSNRFLSRCHCHWFPQCQEKWLQKWSLWWSLRLRVRKQPGHHSRLLILSFLHLRPWGDSTAPSILLAICYFSDRDTWKRYSDTFAVLWCSSICFKQISSLYYGKKYWMSVRLYFGIKIKPHIFHKNDSPW